MTGGCPTHGTGAYAARGATVVFSPPASRRRRIRSGSVSSNPCSAPTCGNVEGAELTWEFPKRYGR